MVHPDDWRRRILFLCSLAVFSSAACAQTVLMTEHRGKTYPVIGADGRHPLIEVDGKRVVASGFKFGLRSVPEFLPMFVSVRGLKVNTSSLSLMDSGQQINNEFHLRADFECATALDNVFLALELTFEDGSKSIYLHEIGDLKPHTNRPLTLGVATSYPLGRGHFRMHLFCRGLEVLHSEIPFSVRESMLDRLVARRIENRADGPPVLFYGPAPEYPEKLGKNQPGEQVVIQVRIRSTGAVVDPKVIKVNEPSLGEAALAAVRVWRFLPRIKDGRAVESVANVPLDFSKGGELPGKG
jgi:TonB family protein